jgi:hypothetical protein
MENHRVRFLVLDKQYMRADAPVPSEYRAHHGDFLAVVYRTAR